jgi:hypothetical protein
MQQQPKTSPHSAGFSAMIASQYMDMIAGVGTFKHSRYKIVILVKDDSADGAFPLHAALEAGKAALYVHQPVFAACNGRIGMGFYQLSSHQFC